MNQFVLGHLPFWIVNYLLALLAWACVGRFVMSAFLPPDSPNYIWRGFRALTAWPVGAAAFLVPSYVGPRWLPLVACCWLFALRWVAGLSMMGAGLAPSITPPG
ncbi:YggT family protein [Roseococcus sp. DSY-14]|uniref:YggT family protein n=1 Tax=Roseococcus sp. DSY-14 TaxID=3369650 RepID=UPI00387AE0E3